MTPGTHTGGVHLPLDRESAYRAVAGRDTRWDGRLYLGVATTGIYCRPSCPARTPLPQNCRYFPTAAAAVAAGFRACRRCRPDALPGSRHWDVRTDLAARAVRLIAEGVLDDAGVQGLASRLAVSERHLHRILVAEVGASPQQLGRTRRAQMARMLLDQTDMPLSEVAFAAGFGSIRQFNDVMRADFGTAPSQLRRPAPRARGATDPSPDSDDGRAGVEAPTVRLLLSYRPPLASAALRRTLAAHVIDGVDRQLSDGSHLRVVDAPSGPAIVRLRLDGPEPPSGAGPATGPDVLPGAPRRPGRLPVTLRLTSLSDLMPVVHRVRRWLDLDADPVEIGAHLGSDPLVGPLVAARPGLRVPGAVDGAELAICAVLGQQVSLSGARLFQSRIAAAFGTPVAAVWPGWTTSARETIEPGGGAPSQLPADESRSPRPPLVFPRAEVLAAAGPQRIRDAANLTRSRALAVHILAEAIAGGLSLDPGAEIARTRTRLLAMPGIGPWTADYITLRALRDPDAFMPSDLVLRKALATATGEPLAALTPRMAEEISRPWRPWRSYALHHLWTTEAYA